MNGYVAFYDRERVEVYADTSFEALEKVAETLNIKTKNRWKISVVLAEKGGVPVEISGASL